MSTPIAAIPTTYRGIRMRSRLEAKWAAMFDLMGWKWEYEAIDLNGWVPDFLILKIENPPAKIIKPILVEIKPIYYYDFPKEIILKIEKSLNHSVEYHVLIFGINPDFIWELNEKKGWIFQTYLSRLSPTHYPGNWARATNKAQWNRNS